LRLAHLALPIAFALLASNASAQDDARANARSLAEKGDSAFAAGRCDRAVPLWKEADKAFSAPSIELRIAHCQALLGHVVDAAQTLDAIARKQLPADAPEAFKSAQAQAVTELPTVKARVASLQISLPPGLALSQLTIDEVSIDVKNSSFPIDPGRHAVRVVAGNATWDGPLELQDGEHHTMQMRMILEPGPEPSHALRNVGLIVGGVGVAALAVGTVLGIAAIDKGKPLDNECGPSRTNCPVSENDRITTVKTFSTASDVFLASGAVLFLAGGFLVIRDLRAERPAPHVRLSVGMSGALLSGVF
jgi:hypothetical protein